MEHDSKVRPLTEIDDIITMESKTGCSLPGQDEDKGNSPRAAEQVWDRDKSKQALLAEGLKPLFVWLSICGLTWNPYCTTTSRYLNFARRCYSIFVLLVCLQQLAVASLCYFRHNTDREIVLVISAQMSFALAFLIWFCGIVFPKRITAFVKEFDYVRSCAHFSAPISNMKKTLNISTLASVFAIIIGVALVVGTAIARLYTPELTCISVPFEEPAILRQLIIVTGPLSTTLMLLTIHMVLILIVTVCILLKREFDACSNGLKSMTDKNTDENVIDVFSKHHKRLCHLTEMTGSFLSVYVGCVYLYSIVVVCFAIYICLLFPNDIFALNTTGLLLYLAVLHLVLVTYFGMKLHHAAHAPLTVLQDLDGRTLNDRVVGLVILLTNKLYQNDIGISVMGLMVITKSTVFTVIGTLLTYIFIVVQFKPSPTSPPTLSGNSTVLP